MSHVTFLYVYFQQKLNLIINFVVENNSVAFFILVDTNWYNVGVFRRAKQIHGFIVWQEIYAINNITVLCWKYLCVLFSSGY